LNVWAWDCDGSLETGGGPVKIDTLKILASQGDIVVIVSPSPNCASIREAFYHLAQPLLGDRVQALKAVKQAFPNASAYYYTGDTEGDRAAAQAAGFSFIFAKEFYSEPRSGCC